MRRNSHRGDEHERMLELAAASLVDSLTLSEKQLLENHLALCQKCHEAHEYYDELHRSAIDSRLPAYPGSIPTNNGWDHAFQRAKLFASLESSRRDNPWNGWVRRALMPVIHGTYREALPAAAILAVIAISLGWGLWIGIHRPYVLNTSRVHENPNVVSSPGESLKAQTALEAELADNRKRVLQLQLRTVQQEGELTRLAAQRDELVGRLTRLQAENAREDTALISMSGERDSTKAKLTVAEEVMHSVQEQLTNLRDQRSRELLHAASLEFKIQQLGNQLAEKDRTIALQQEFLASDRDVRELMGARQLYIADVVDIDHDGRNRAPFGRVFYTKGKSLIFFGFDLDREPGFKDPSVFQVWGHTEGKRQVPLDLGVFYKDNETNRRWVLKFDKPELLSQINALFVTVEPHGRSRQPTGKPFLYTYLRKTAPNHP